MSTRPDKQASVPYLLVMTLISGLSMVAVLLLGNGISPLQFEPRSAANQDCICALAIHLPARERFWVAESR